MERRAETRAGRRFVRRCRVGGPMAVVLLSLACGAGRTARPPSLPSGAPAGATFPFVLDVAIGDESRGGLVLRRVALEDYVAGCVAAELGGALVPPSEAADRLGQVQAVLCRSFAAASPGRHHSDGYDLCATTHCQLYRPAPSSGSLADTVARALRATEGLVVVAGSRIVATLYHAHCGGRTSAADAVWSGPPQAGLVSVNDEFCDQAASRWRFQVDRDRLRRALATDVRTDIGGTLRDIRVTSRDPAGRVTSVALEGERPRAVRGEVFRTVLIRALGPLTLRSTRFRVARVGGDFVFGGSGNGHGVGLCQAGAVARARAGHSAEAILRHYYPGTRVERLR